MAEGAEQIFLSDDVLAMMRNAARLSGTLREPFITVRTLVLALLDEPVIGPAIAAIVPREKLESYALPEDGAARMTAKRVQEPHFPEGERPAILRFDTLAFKVPDGGKSVWLSREAQTVWDEAAKRVGEDATFMPKHVALGVAANAIKSPGVLMAMGISPGDLSEALRKL